MSSTTRLVTVLHDGLTRHVALFSGLQPNELSDLLCSVFSLNSSGIIGFSCDVLLPFK